MKTPVAALACVVGLLAGVAATAQVPPPEEKKAPEAKVEHLVSEDEAVRIEERRYRGQTEAITVKSKLRGVAPYEILPSSGGRDPSQPGNTGGQRVWHFLSF